MVAPRSTETHNVTLKNLTPFGPKVRASSRSEFSSISTIVDGIINLIALAYSKNLRIRTYNCATQPRFLYIKYVVGNEAVQVLRLVLIFFRTFMNFFYSDHGWQETK